MASRGAIAKTRDEIREYWRRWPNAAIRLPTGAVNGLFVIDLDTIEGHGIDGRESPMSLQVKHYNGDWPRTKMTKSPTGSVHHIQVPSRPDHPKHRWRTRSRHRRAWRRWIRYRAAVDTTRTRAYKRITYCDIANHRDGCSIWWRKNLAKPKALSPEFSATLMAMMRANAGLGVSFSPDDCFGHEPDLKLKIACRAITSQAMITGFGCGVGDDDLRRPPEDGYEVCR